MLDSLEWAEPAEEMMGDIAELMKSHLGDLPYNPETARIRFAPLPFYKYFSLLEIDDSTWPRTAGPLWFVGNHSFLRHLDGSSAPIHDANQLGAVSITAENAAGYMEFFCFFVHGDEGPFFVVERGDHPVFDTTRLTAEQADQIAGFVKPARYLGTTESGIHEISATILYGNALFDARFAVTGIGMIEMIDDEPLMADIPAIKLKPNY